MNEAADIDGKLAPLMEHFGERTNRIFAYFFCALEFEEDEDLSGDPGHNLRTWRLQTITNACLDTSLIALRDLDDFLQTRTAKTKADDIRASDFGYPGTHAFLSASDRADINKLIAHTTSTGAHAQGFRWDILELATKGVAQATTFLQWVERHYGLRCFRLYTAAAVIRRKSEAQIEAIAREARARRGRVRPGKLN